VSSASQDEVVYSVAYTVSGRTITCPSGTFVLDAALAAGLKLPFNCRQGLCGTCKSKLLSGQYDMHHQGGIRPKEIANGMFLPCCSKPLSDLVIEK
jgi:ferredoxin